MKKIIINILLILIITSCKNDIQDKSISIVQDFQKGKLSKIRNAFYSDEYFNSLPNAKEVIINYPVIIGSLKIDSKENIIIETRKAHIHNKHFPKDSVIVTSVYVPLGIKLPSPIPRYMFQLHFVKDKLVAFNLLDTKSNNSLTNELEIKQKIDIDKYRIRYATFMYEGGYKNPLVFKNKNIVISQFGKSRQKFETLINLINESKIIKSQKEIDTKRFVGNPELDIIHLNLNNNFTWTIFSLKSEEPNNYEKFEGAIELRYYEHLNVAITYWIDSKNNKLLKEIISEFCQLGDNKRIEPKKSVKLELD